MALTRVTSFLQDSDQTKSLQCVTLRSDIVIGILEKCDRAVLQLQRAQSRTTTESSACGRQGRQPRSGPAGLRGGMPTPHSAGAHYSSLEECQEWSARALGGQMPSLALIINDKNGQNEVSEASIIQRKCLLQGRADHQVVPLRAGLHAGTQDHLLLYGQGLPAAGDHVVQGRDRALLPQFLPGERIIPRRYPSENMLHKRAGFTAQAER